MIENQLREPPGRSTRYSGMSLIGPPRTVIWVLGILLAALLVYALRDLVLILFLSVFLAYFINPIVKIVESRVIKREIAVAVVYLGIVLSLLALAYFVFPLLRAEINALSEGWPSFTDRLDDAIDSIQNEIVLRFPSADRLLTTREVRYQKLNGFIEQQMANIPALSGRVASMVVAGLLIPFFSYFFLRDSRKIIQFVLDRLAARHIETSVAVWCEINRIVGRYLRGLAINSALVGMVAAEFFLSSSGIGLAADQEFPIGDRMRLGTSINGIAISAEISVVATTSIAFGRFRTGCQFRRMPLDTQHKLDALTTQHTQRGA